MRALTLTQPWAGLVASGIKLIENRPRAMIKHEDFGTPFALHASRECDWRVFDRIFEIAPELRDGHKEADWTRFAAPLSAVVGVATVADCVRRWWTLPDGTIELRSDVTGKAVDLGEQVRWFFGPIGYVLRDVRALRSAVPCRGWQGFWTLPADVEAQVRAQIAEAA